MLATADDETRTNSSWSNRAGRDWTVRRPLCSATANLL